MSTYDPDNIAYISNILGPFCPKHYWPETCIVWDILHEQCMPSHATVPCILGCLSSLWTATVDLAAIIIISLWLSLFFQHFVAFWWDHHNDHHHYWIILVLYLFWKQASACLLNSSDAGHCRPSLISIYLICNRAKLASMLVWKNFQHYFYKCYTCFCFIIALMVVCWW